MYNAFLIILYLSYETEQISGKSCLFHIIILYHVSFAGTYKDGLAPDGKILSDHMLLGTVVATILIIDNTTQVSII